MGKDRRDNELYEYQYTTPNKKVVKEFLPAVKKPNGKKQGKKYIFWGRNLIFLGIILLVFNISGIFSQNFLFGILKLIPAGVITGLGLNRLKTGNTITGRIARYGRYMKALEVKKYASVEELALKVAKKPKTVIDDLEYMIQNGWFLEGHLDPGKTQFMLTDSVYEQYQLSLKGQQLKEEEEKRRMEIENDPIQKELSKVLQDGEAYIKRIHKLNDMILGDDISTKMDNIENTLISIFELLKRKPEKMADIRKLMQYYLPMTVKILEKYRDFENERIPSEQLKEGKAEIEETLEKVHIAFENLREKLFREDILDVSTDLDVLETMMSQEGLIDNDLSMKIKLE